MKVLITGAAGFIGSHVVADIIENTDWHVTIIDRLDCSGNLNRLDELGAAKHPRIKFVYHDLRGEINDLLATQLGSFDYILHLAASTHVDRSIIDPMAFVFDNVVATGYMLQFARKSGCQKFICFGTDEIFGPAPMGVRYKEWDRYKSGNPYAATKAGAEELAIAFHNTYGVPVIATHTMNVLAEMQHPEKYAPSTIRKVVLGETVKVHAYPDLKRAGSRFYIDAKHVANALRFLLEHGEIGEKYNIVGAKETDNLQLAHMIADAVGKPLEYELVDFHSSRKGHDPRYALDGTKLANMGWKHPCTLEETVCRLVQWSLKHPQWLGLSGSILVADQKPKMALLA